MPRMSQTIGVDVDCGQPLHLTRRNVMIAVGSRNYETSLKTEQ